MHNAPVKRIIGPGEFCLSKGFRSVVGTLLFASGRSAQFRARYFDSAQCNYLNTAVSEFNDQYIV